MLLLISAVIHIHKNRHESKVLTLSSFYAFLEETYFHSTHLICSRRKIAEKAIVLSSNSLDFETHKNIQHLYKKYMELLKIEYYHPFRFVAGIVSETKLNEYFVKPKASQLA